MGQGSDEKKPAVFCMYIDSATFKLLCSLCAPKKPEEPTSDKLQFKLDTQFGTKKIVLAKRYQFYSYKQLEGQSPSDYIVELHHLAATCDWSELTGIIRRHNICDKFMMGLRNECLLQQLLMQDHKKPLEEFMELAHVFEAAEWESLKWLDSE